MGNAVPEPRTLGADADAKPTAPSEPRAVAAAGAGDTRAILRSIVGSAIGLATLMLMLAGLAIQQNAGVNARIDDLSAGVNARIDDLSAGVNARIDDLSASVNARIDDVNARIDDLQEDVNARIDDLQEDVRELRTLIIAAIERPDPVD